MKNFRKRVKQRGGSEKTAMKTCSNKVKALNLNKFSFNQDIPEYLFSKAALKQ